MNHESAPATGLTSVIGWNTPLTVTLAIVLSVIHILPIAWQLMQAGVLVILCAGLSYFIETKSWGLIREYGNRSDIGQRIIASIEHAVGIASDTKNTVKQNISGWKISGILTSLPPYFGFGQKEKTQ